MIQARYRIDMKYYEGVFLFYALLVGLLHIILGEIMLGETPAFYAVVMSALAYMVVRVTERRRLLRAYTIRKDGFLNTFILTIVLIAYGVFGAIMLAYAHWLYSIAFIFWMIGVLILFVTYESRVFELRFSRPMELHADLTDALAQE